MSGRVRTLFEHDLVGKPVPTFPDHASQRHLAADLGGLHPCGGFALRRLPALTPADSRQCEVHSISERVSVNEVEGGGHVGNW